MATNYASTDCPAVPPVGSVMWLDNTAANPPTSSPLVQGQPYTAVLNRDFKASDLGHRYGAGGYGIGYGLGLSAGTGLLVAVADGQALIDGIVEVRSAANVVLAASSVNWIWLRQDGTLIAQDDTTAKPSGNCCLLGAAVTDGTGVTSIDTSGVVYWLGGQMWRTTNDLGKPADTPSSSLRFFTRTQTGVWFWDGASYQRLDSRGYLSVAMASDANKTLAANEYAAEILKITSGVSLTATRQIILPTDVARYHVLNATTGGQSLTVKTSGGSGVTVANGKAATLFCDGTNVVRLTDDATF